MKTRADVFLVRNGLSASRTAAAALIEAEAVLLRGVPIKKASQPVDDADLAYIEVTDVCPYVGRGGYKLAGALDVFGVEPKGLVCADIGASTGGFTDCLLQRGAARVYAVDAGSGQLADKLLRDTRVINIEKCNARYPLTDAVKEPCGLVVSDVSFISQTLILPNIPAVLSPDGFNIALVKPQFECGRAALNKQGIVKDRSMHAYAIKRVADAAFAAGLSVCRAAVSPIAGGDGNREFLLLCRKKTPASYDLTETEIRRLTGE